jgi:hypothetical protein
LGNTCKTSHGRLVQVVGGGEVDRGVALLMCLRSPNFRLERSSHVDRILSCSMYMIMTAGVSLPQNS